jgi:SAM-dependent methyltransferase
VKTTLLQWVRSPCCGSPLKFKTLTEFPRTEEIDVQGGELVCTTCKRGYPIVGGVPRLLVGAQSSDVEKTRDSFSWEWARYPGALPEDAAVFLEESQLKPEDFAGKLVLDAGCGMGRYSMIALRFGATVVALDLSESLRRLADVAPEHPKLHVVQGDLLNPPFKKALFDVVYSHGVLHHTSDTKKAFDAVAPLVKPGGLMNVWLYGKAGRFQDFATNPLRKGREWIGRHRRLAWTIVGVRHVISDFIRFFTTRLPAPIVYALCFPLALLGVVPGVKYFTFSVHRNFMVRVIENFDWIAPPFQYHHTKEELVSWFESAGFAVLKVLPHGLIPKPGVLGRKRQDRSQPEVLGPIFEPVVGELD